MWHLKKKNKNNISCKKIEKLQKFLLQTQFKVYISHGNKLQINNKLIPNLFHLMNIYGNNIKHT